VKPKPGKPKRKPRRVVLGVGHPWFSADPGTTFMAVRLTTSEVSRSILLRTFDWRAIKTGGLGNWNKIRLIAEVLK
jgi:hypothetical protein